MIDRQTEAASRYDTCLGHKASLGPQVIEKESVTRPPTQGHCEHAEMRELHMWIYAVKDSK